MGSNRWLRSGAWCLLSFCATFATDLLLGPLAKSLPHLAQQAQVWLSSSKQCSGRYNEPASSEAAANALAAAPLQTGARRVLFPLSKSP